MRARQLRARARGASAESAASASGARPRLPAPQTWRSTAARRRRRSASTPPSPGQPVLPFLPAHMAYSPSAAGCFQHCRCLCNMCCSCAATVLANACGVEEAMADWYSHGVDSACRESKALPASDVYGGHGCGILSEFLCDAGRCRAAGH